MTHTSSCPTPQELERLVLGQLPEPEAERSEQHLMECAACLRTVQTLMERDTLAEVMRSGRQPAGEVMAPGRSGPDQTMSETLSRLREERAQ